MADFMTSEQRTLCMSRVKSKVTTLELYIRKALWHAGFRYRLNRNFQEIPISY
ncbi:MAG: hypothetical protein JZU65_17335 [Chlorobium sp.]|nr:hypothetical protein [Chlorobium sp.]